MIISFHLDSYMRGISQDEFLKRMKSLDLTASKSTINQICNNDHSLKYLPVSYIIAAGKILNLGIDTWIDIEPMDRKFALDTLPTTDSQNDSHVIFRLKELLIQRKWKQNDLKNELLKRGIKVRANTISAICNNTIKELPLDVLAGICDIFSVIPGVWIEAPITKNIDRAQDQFEELASEFFNGHQLSVNEQIHVLSTYIVSLTTQQITSDKE